MSDARAADCTVVTQTCLVAGTLVVSGSSVATSEERPRADALQSAASNDIITLYYGLQRKEKKAKRALKRIADPNHGSYRQFVDRDKLAKDYGVKRKAKKAVRSSARAAGLTFALDYSGVFARVTGSVANMQSWLGQSITSASGDGMTIYVATGSGVPADVKKHVKEAIPYYQKQTGVLSAAGGLPKNRGTWVGGCKAAKKSQAYSFKQLTNAYGKLSGRGNTKNGKQTVLAILSAGDGYSDSHLTTAKECFNSKGRKFKRVATDGLTGPLPAGTEGDLDTQMAQAICLRSAPSTT